MSRARLIVVLLAAAGSAACGQGKDPCAFGASGAGWLAFTSLRSGGSDVQIVRADGTCRRALAADGAGNFDPAWGPGGIVAYDSDRGSLPGVWLHDVRSGAERLLDVGALVASSPAFSPDGTRLAFEGRAPGATTGSIYVVPVAGGTPVELTPEATPHGNGGPVFSPDGATTVYFVSNRSGPYDVFAVPSAGGPAVQVTTGSGIVGKPAISPDGRTLAFTRVAGASTEVVFYDLGTAVTTPLGIPGAAEPSFDPRGGRLAILAFHGPYPTIDLAPLSGAPLVRVTFGPGPDGAPAFAPLGP